jgi:UDP-N-acetylmuramoyl-L-alanyl-D-glutamate--2,6-diaminopimelate ligase
MKKLSLLLKAVELPYKIFGKDVDISSICYDSRKVENNSLFVAIKGFQHDGHDHVNEAIFRGAVAIVIDHEIPVSITKIITSDTRRALAELSYNFYDANYNQFDLIGITGTNGKTTITHLLYQLAEQDRKTPALIGTLGIKTPGMSLEGTRTTPESVDLAKHFSQLNTMGVNSVFMEVSSHAIALKRVHSLRFDSVIFTNLTQDHLDFHADMEDYFETKSKLFYQMKAGAKAIVNIDDAYGKRLFNKLEVGKFSYSVEDPTANYYFKDLQIDIHGVRGTFIANNKEFTINSPLLGRFNAENISASIACWDNLYPESRLDLNKVTFSPVPGRMETIDTSKAKAVVDYAHTPDAMGNALKTAYTLEGRKKMITVFGCGGDRDKDKRPKMGKIAEAYSDRIIITNDNPRNEDPKCIAEDILKGIQDKSKVNVCLDRAKAIQEGWENSEKGDILMVLGKGAETYIEIKGRTIHFDDRERIRELELI